MKIISRIQSASGKEAIEVLRISNGSYLLRRVFRRWDEEEEVFYEIEEQPHLSSRFGDLETALAEAHRLVGLKD